MSAPWAEVLDVQATLATSIARPGLPRRLVEAFGETIGVGVRNSTTGREWALVEWEATQVALADPYWVSAEMLDVVDYAAPTLPDEVLLPSDLPTENGFALLERSVVRRDVRGQRVSFRAVSWAVASPATDGNRAGVLYTLWVDRDEQDDDVNAWYRSGPDPLMRRTLTEGGRFQVMRTSGSWSSATRSTVSGWKNRPSPSTATRRRCPKRSASPSPMRRGGGTSRSGG